MERLRGIEVLRIPHYLTYLHADLRPYLNSIEGSLPEPSDQALVHHESCDFSWH